MYFNLKLKLFVTVLAVILAICVVRSTAEDCVCNARFVGEYCGTELSGNCSKELIYFCGKSNLRGGVAIPLRSCSEKGYECNSKNKDNPCFANLHCNCGDSHRRRKKYCGSDLVGAGCKAGIVYKCPMFRSSKLQVEDGCPNGCADGKCL